MDNIILIFTFIILLISFLLFGLFANKKIQSLINENRVLSENFNNKIQDLNNNLNSNIISSLNKLNDSNENFHKNVIQINNKLDTNEKLKDSLDVFNRMLNSKQDRGYFGEQQLSLIISDMFNKEQYSEQYTLKNGSRADFVLHLPNNIIMCIDSKFPLESYKQLLEVKNLENEKNFFKDIKKHIDDISSKYIINKYTTDFAVMFVPAESIFIEIMKSDLDIANYAYKKKVIIVSPSTIISVLSTALTIVKDDIIQKQQYIIKDNLEKIFNDFNRYKKRKEEFDSLLNNLIKKKEEIEISENKIISNIEKIINLDINKED